MPAPDDAPTSAGLRPGQRALIGVVRLYRGTLGHWLGGHCRFTPTCSQYAIDAVTRYGTLRGGWKTLRRLARCHPLGGRGYDPA